MSFRGFVHDVLVSVARVDEPVATRPLPAWLVSLTRTSHAFSGGSATVIERPVRRRLPARGGLVLAMAVVVAMLVIPTAFAWVQRDSVYEPGGIGGPALSTASPPAVSVPPNPGFSLAYDTRLVIPGEDAGRQTVTGVDLRRPSLRTTANDLTVTARTTATTIRVGPKIRGAYLSPAHNGPAACAQAIDRAAFPADNVFSAKRDLRFCLLLPPADETDDLLVAFTVEDVAANGSITLRLTAWRVEARFTFATSGSAPRCTTLSGTGTRPTGGEIALFIRNVSAPYDYYYEGIVTFDPRDRWTATVVLGVQTKHQLRFVLSAVAVTAAEAAALRSNDGRPYAVSDLPGTILAEQQVVRTDDSGAC
ncbi:MAG TPA: hypothetical protein VGP16_15920 [Asanoa sp.]|nr:hypothetical protein [Asanoa sp.]